MLATRLMRAFAQIPVELTKQGRYAYALYKSAEEQKLLDVVKTDMDFVRDLFTKSPDFQVLISNPSLKRQTVGALISELMSKAEFSVPATNLVKLLLENGRLKFLNDVAGKFLDYYKLKDRRETVRVVSAMKLTAEEQKSVEVALKTYSPDTKYDLSYQIEPSILGGLQLYFPTAFMDLSLKSRLDKIKEELSALAP